MITITITIMMRVLCDDDCVEIVDLIVYIKTTSISTAIHMKYEELNNRINYP